MIPTRSRQSKPSSPSRLAGRFLRRVSSSPSSRSHMEPEHPHATEPPDTNANSRTQDQLGVKAWAYAIAYVIFMTLADIASSRLFRWPAAVLIFWTAYIHITKVSQEWYDWTLVVAAYLVAALLAYEVTKVLLYICFVLAVLMLFSAIRN